MKVEVIQEAGIMAAAFGLGLSYGTTSNERYQDHWSYKKIHDVMVKLSTKDGGHNKFLRQIAVWLDIDAPRFWWSEFDTYKIGTTAQSESTMHTLGKRKLTQDDFEYGCIPEVIVALNDTPDAKEDLLLNKNILPEGFLQRRIVSLNYQVLREIVKQRKGHRLPQWLQFIDAVLAGVEHPEFLEVSTKAG